MERWLLTYSDMITLLLALFVILFALSTINAKKFEAFKVGISKSFSPNPVHTKSSGLLPKQSSLVAHPSSVTTPTLDTPAAAPSSRSMSLSQIASQINQVLQGAGLGPDATTTVSTRSVTVQVLADKAYFALDSATLGPIGDRVVDVIAGELRTIPNDVRVEGFTDNTPIVGGPYSSNWALSAARAVNVVQRLDAQDGITANRLSAIGYGTTHPVVPNTTPANRAENRRIDVVILTSRLASPTGSGGSAP